MTMVEGPPQAQKLTHHELFDSFEHQVESPHIFQPFYENNRSVIVPKSVPSSPHTTFSIE